ncbi:MAG: VTT domain-containing protein [Candidatus Heimdallarchaeota archaeon]|nr:VTT domain-containing protein [Candidatus Heimdallarchaeota archaeon]
MPSLVFLGLLIMLIIQAFIPGFPKETLLLQAGIIFGTLLGGILNWLGMVFAAQFAYEVVRRSVEQGGRYSSLISRYEQADFLIKLQKSGNIGLFVLRLLPFSPNDVLSLISGALKLPRRGFVLVSLITAIPYAFLFAYIGATGSKYIDQELLLHINGKLILLFLVIGGFYTLVRHKYPFMSEDLSTLPK